MKKSEITATVLMMGLLIFAGIKFGERTLPREQLRVLQDVSGKLDAGYDLNYEEEEKAGGMLKVSPEEFGSELPAHAGIFSSILKRLSFLMPVSDLERMFPPEGISRKIYLSYVKIIYFIRRMEKYVVLAGIFVILIGPIVNKFGLYFISSFVGRAGFILSLVLLNVLAVTLLLAWILIRTNFWVPVNISIFGIPAGLLILSSIALKLHDPNFPLWNRVIKSLVLPLVISFAVVGRGILFS